uniref:Uncharacterized protein n=1 Tax=Sphaerodactylus townsendi TaxID=933632 RepID=A0ACB8G6T3_9SAUR
MSGGEAGGGGGAITLEELQGLGDEEEEEEEEEEEGDCPEHEQEHEQRLLGFWQSVARGHRVDVPPDMAQPIQQLTRNNHGQGRESISFTVIKRKEKFGKVLYEKRHYAKGRWACVKVQEDQYEQSVCLGFMKIMKYICEQNSSGLYLGMTVPIVIVIHTGVTIDIGHHKICDSSLLPPWGAAGSASRSPMHPDIIIEEWPPVAGLCQGLRRSHKLCPPQVREMKSAGRNFWETPKAVLERHFYRCRIHQTVLLLL